MNIKDFEKLKLMHQDQILGDRVRHVDMSSVAVDVYLDPETDEVYQVNKTEKEYRKADSPAGSPYQDWNSLGGLAVIANLYPIKNTAATGNINVQIDEETKTLLENTPRGEEVEFEVYLDSGHSFYPYGVNVKQSYEEMVFDTVTVSSITTDVPKEDVYPYLKKIKLKGIVD